MTKLQLFKRVRSVKYIHLEPETASYFAERENGTLRLLFEESNGKTDWKNNFRFFAIPRKPYKDMTAAWFAHRGFLGVWKTIEPRLAETIADPTVTRIEIAGYSHGGAIALLCYEYCKFNRPDIEVTGVGFGAPRVVWGPVPREVKKRMADFLVIRNGGDIVTHVPPRIFGFRHIGKVEVVGKPVGPFADHFPSAYRNALADK